MFDQHLLGSITLFAAGVIVGLVTWQTLHRRRTATHQTVEIPDDLPADWPKYWGDSSTTYLECGSEGRFHTTIHTSSHPASVHIANFRAISERWAKLWPAIRTTVADTLHCPHIIRCPGAVLHLSVPDARINGGVKWEATLRFHNEPGSWTTVFSGWSLDSSPGFVD